MNTPPQQPPRRGSEREDEDKDEAHEAQDAEEEEEEREDMEEGNEEDETFICRFCKRTVDVGDGEETFALCDRCARDYDIDKMWEDFDDEVISEHQAKTISLERYWKRKSSPKQQKGGQYRGPPRH